MRFNLFPIVALLLTLNSPMAQATLIARLGGQAFYDTTLDVTWLADANYAVTSGYAVSNAQVNAQFQVQVDGTMNLNAARAWASSLNVDGVTGWRLPVVRPVNGTEFGTFAILSNNGSTDFGTGATGGGWINSFGFPSSEMGWMYYGNLGNLGYSIPNGGGTNTSSIAQPGWGLNNSGPFVNIQINWLYWANTFVGANLPEATFPTFGNFYFNFDNGGQVISPGGSLYAWAVHDGDVRLEGEPYGQEFDWSSGAPVSLTVPEPAVLSLFAFTLLVPGFARCTASKVRRESPRRQQHRCQFRQVI